ncbi:putative coiled coil protein [Cryptosporidium canis]|uniref:Coiled coil protein n=1 Tax=Cryptosporidium canis TaxID=195482 RepID=A0A9D5DJ26_9CRYT|nr:putative coiled coil protein [Cryptosporidium canis]
MQQDEIFQENLELFLKNCELSKEVGWRVVENADLLGRLNDYKENQKSLELFIKKLKEDEIDSCLSEITAKNKLQESQKIIGSLEKYNEYLKTMLCKYMSASSRMNQILNGGKILSEMRFGHDSEEDFRENLKGCLETLELLSFDMEEQIKYKERYKQLRVQNKSLRDTIEKLAKLEPIKKVKMEVSLNILEPGESSGEVNSDISKEENILDKTDDYSAPKPTGHEADIEQYTDISYEVECSNYLVKQYRKENFELKQKIFEYEFNNTSLNLDELVESELKEKQRELDELEMEYSNWVIKLQEENSNLRKVIEIQEREQSEFIDYLTQKNMEKTKEMQEMQMQLVENYEERLREQSEELKRVKNESQRENENSVRIESLNKIVKSMEEKLLAISNEKQRVLIELEKMTNHLKDTGKRLAINEEALKQKNREFDALKVEQEKTLQQYYHEKKLHQKFEQDAHSLRKELDNVLSDMYKNQKKSRFGTSGEDCDKISSVENIIKHCKELETKVDELNHELEQYKCGKCVSYPNSSINNAEIETLFDQVQSLKKEREQLKKDIRQRDWAKIEVEILHKRTTEEIDQIKRDNTRLMLENLRLRDSSVVQGLSHPCSNNENVQANSERTSITGSRRESIIKQSSDLTSSNPEEGNTKNVSRNSAHSLLNLKAPRRPSLLIQ